MLSFTPRDLKLSSANGQGRTSAFPSVGRDINVPYHVNSAFDVIECEARSSQQVYQTKKDVPARHLIALVAEMSGVRVYYPTKLTEPHEGQDQSKLISAQRHQSAPNISMERFDFFATANGSIGIGLDTILPGDAVYIVFPAHTPYILRRNPNSESYRVQGPPYVHGTMDGESFATRNSMEN
ncbi:hypothetical protein MMC07_002741 [Pseudocyphellaria aurata]|nr:hypothetical protein [Pseudocyphellaria aurata]